MLESDNFALKMKKKKKKLKCLTLFQFFLCGIPPSLPPSKLIQETVRISLVLIATIFSKSS